MYEVTYYPGPLANVLKTCLHYNSNNRQLPVLSSYHIRTFGGFVFVDVHWDWVYG